MTELEYMTARIYALSSQLHFFSGQTHPYYDYALKEFAYIINEIAKRPAHKTGVKIARSIRYRLENEDEERRATKTFVSCLSPAQAYRLAEAAIHHRIKLKTAYELYLEELDEEEANEECDDSYNDSYNDSYDDTPSAF